jgi:bifunctional non-homologous end joining protein LigD
VTGRAFPDLNSRKKPTGRELQPITNQIQKRIKAAFVEPMQCMPVTALPMDEKWTFEIKFDGYRCIAVKRGKEATLFSRHRKVLNKRFPGVVDALTSVEASSFSTANWSR